MAENPISVCLTEWDICDPKSDEKLVDTFLDGDPSIIKIINYLSKNRMLEISELKNGLSIESYSYVGRIQLGPLQITIRPKIKGAPFLQLLKYAYGLRNLKLEPFDDRTNHPL